MPLSSISAAAMKFVIESVSKCSKARIGSISNIERLPDKTYTTPLLLLNNVQLSKEVLELSGIDYTNDFALSLPVINVEQMEKPVKLSQKTISEFIGLKLGLTFMFLKNPSSFSPSGSHEKGSVPIFKKGGRMNITTQRHMDLVETLKPDFFTTLSDGDTFPDCPKKRVVKSAERSEEFFEECLRLYKTLPAESQSASTMIASIEGGFSVWERKRMVEQALAHQGDIAGYFLDGFHRNGSEATALEASTLKEIVDYTLNLLPSDKMKIMSGAYHPTIVLDLIQLGVDILDSSFADIVTNENRAIVFNFDFNQPQSTFPEIDLLDEKFKDDFSPFVSGCQCIACRNHTKAYTHHLLKTNELLGPMLLSIHNLFHYKKFFTAIQQAIKEEKLSELTKLVADQYNEVARTSLFYKTLSDEKLDKVDDSENKKRTLKN